MDPVTLIVLPGLLGGLVLALLFIRLQRRHRSSEAAPDAFRERSLSTDVINMSRIRVAGIGGLGMVAMAVCVAWFVPRIGQTLAIGLVAGVLFALALIMWRRAAGPMPSSGQRAGANTTLSINAPRTGETERTRSGAERHELGATSVRTARAI